MQTDPYTPESGTIDSPWNQPTHPAIKELKSFIELSNHELLYLRTVLAGDIATVAPKYVRSHTATDLINRINLTLSNRSIQS